MTSTNNTIANIHSYPVHKHLSWWPDWEFTNDLLLNPQRPLLEKVTLSAAAEPRSFETVINIQFEVNNLTQNDIADLRVCAIIIDDFGILMTHGDTRLITNLTDLTADSSRSAQLSWQQDCSAQSYHLILRLEEPSGNLIDVVSGDFVIS